MPGLDKFYTQEHVAKQCFEFLHSQLNISENAIYLEPSAGAGSFINLLSHYIALDIAPEDDRIKKQDYLKYEVDKENFITIGNPPFGNRSKLAIDFFNKAATMSDVIAFILPVSFMKWSVQKNLNKDFKLIFSQILEPNSFIFSGKDCSIRCCFQIWTRCSSDVDLRLKKAPPTTHKSFEMWQYNNTIGARKYFDKQRYKWDFAVVRQGFYDYNHIILQENELNPKIQYIFFKAYDDKTGMLTIGQFKHDSYALLKRTKKEYAFCYINIINFKIINQLHGVAFADKLIKYISNEIDLFFCGAKNTSLNKNLIDWEIIKQKAKLTTKGEQNE